MMQNRASSGACPEDVKKISSSEPESGISNNKRTVFSGGEEGIEHLSVANSRRSIIDMDNEDAICKRTRARYSLASRTLDELEAFLQETDDEDDLQNANDYQEYRKFLAAVLLIGDGNSGNVQENENVDDEDEDNDADFELEIEEALESDIDEHVKGDVEEEYEAVSRRPKTRQTRRQRASLENKKKVLGLSNPLLPYLPISPYSGHGAKSMTMPRCSLASLSLSPANDGFINGFTAHQIGQLHCLIHEHVQLLIQVFAVCVLEPARRHIASDVRELISLMLHKRDEVLASRSVPYPSFCFFFPYVHPSMSDEPSKTSPAQITNKMSSAHVSQGDCSSGLNMVQPFDGISPSRGRHDAFNQVGCPVGSWVPYINGSILSVLDVAPIKLVKDFMDDVSHAMQDYRHQQVGGMDDICSEKEPLFPVQNIHFTAEPDVQASLYSNVVPPPSSSLRTSKKTMAAVLVEKAKKQAAAPVPKEIAKLAQRFFPLFNPALYPHKPPPAAVANRVLFTDAEDELLALGLMEYNTDWRAIQQRYLPCKSKHQIFVRQKNRSSSKAPENPIKAVRRIKNSPLTAEEVARIEEGLKVFKLDWVSVWKFIVPYRDPSLLPRQWRIAIGTQKSYKSDASKKAKRRLYEERRKSKAAALETWHVSSEKEDNVADYTVTENSGADNCTERDEEAYVHEAFLADWRPAVSSIQVNHSMSDLAEKIPPAQLLGDESSPVAEEMNSSRSGNGQSHISNEFPASLRASETESFSRPYRARKFNNGQLVKLAPGLPPVNLPPSVRVISQSAFKSYHGGTYPRTFGGDGCTGDTVRDNTVPKIASATKNYFVKDGPFIISAGRNTISNHNLQETSVSKDNKNVTEGKDELGLQMHPLLFRAPEDGPLPYYQSNSSFSTSSSFSFFSGCQPQLNLSLFHHPRQLAHTVNFLDKSSKLRDKTSISSGFDFHPLLQRNDDANCDLEAASSAAPTLCISESSKGRCTQVQNAADSSSNVACSMPSSPVGKSNEVDLEMHLSVTSRKQKAMGSRGAVDHYMGRSPTSASDSGDQNHQINRTPNRTAQHHDSSATAMILSSDQENGNDVDYMADQSLAEIVMEQEELSDSEEEIGEDVEFECEEMEDSGEEIFESEEINNDKNEMSKQYLANVSLKINVEVGGRNTVLVDVLSRRIPLVRDRPTIIFGADVTHTHPGEDSSPSIASVVASQDWPEITKYAGLVSAQAHRLELIQDLYKSWQDPVRGPVTSGMIKELLISFRRATAQKPQRIIFYRDGVSEGQFYQVLLFELDAIRKACASLEPNYQPPVTFVVVQKRHHTRLFANNHHDRNAVDRSGNILPGTVVDSKICHPTEFDFYLCSHAGYSRSAHYHVLWDENNFTADALQSLTYARCTRSVFIAYYAHLAAFRARFYVEPKTSDSGPLPALKENVKRVMFYC